METYCVPPEDLRNSTAKMIGRGAAIAVLFFFVSFAADWSFGKFRNAAKPVHNAVDFGISAVIVVVVMMATERQRRNGKVTIDGDFIVLKENGGFRKFHRDQIRTIVERKENFLRAGGMIISRYGRIGTFFMGGIWVPRELGGYEKVKSFAERDRG